MKNSKQELLDAYQQVVHKLARGAEEDAPQAKLDAERRRQETLVASARSTTVNGIVASIGSLKLDIASVLNNVSQKLVEQVDKFRQIEEATAVETKRLAELHDIEVAADTLALLVQRHQEAEAQFESRVMAKRAEVQEALARAKEQTEEEIESLRATFSAEIDEKRAEWAREQAAHDAIVKERTEQVRRQREREQEEYQYALKLQRTRDEDAYAARREGLEKDLKERRAEADRVLKERQDALLAREAEWKELRERAQAYPAELQKAAELAEKKGRALALREAETASRLREQEIAGDRQLLQLRIDSLQTKVVEQANRLEDLSRQLTEATGKVQDIAVKAIEGAAGRRALDAVNEIALEQAKQKRPS
jgi:hypothetical protein